MEVMSISASELLVEALIMILFFGLPIISLIALEKRKLSSLPLAIWAVLIVVVPLMGSIAYWIIRPTAEMKA